MMSNLYETWTLKQEIPEPFVGIVQKNGGRRTSLKQEDCSRYNTGRAKSAVLHPPTLQAMAQYGRDQPDGIHPSQY